MKRLTVTGNMGRDAEMRVDPNGHQFATFSVGIDVGNKVNPKTDWIEVSCNGKLAEVITTYGKKGRKVLVEGFPYVQAYLNKDNIPAASLRMYANTIELLSKWHDDAENDEVNSVSDHEEPTIHE